jgi:hypothetical protein
MIFETFVRVSVNYTALYPTAMKTSNTTKNIFLASFSVLEIQYILSHQFITFNTRGETASLISVVIFLSFFLENAEIS